VSTGRRRAAVPARVRVPADVERPDRVLAGLTARQLALLAGAAVALWAAYLATRRAVSPAAFVAAALPLGAVALFLAVGRVEGAPADRVLAAAWRQWQAPARLVPAPDGAPPPPAFVAGRPGPLPAPLRLPLRAIGADGVADLGADGQALLARASSVTFSLRTAGEQEALVAGFARWLNSLTEPVQLLVRAEPVDLAPMVAALLDAAPGLPHPALEEAARDHARFLCDLGRGHTLLRREVLVVLREPGTPGAAERLARRAEEATAALAGAGVALAVLDGPQAAACLARAVDPGAAAPPAGMAVPGQVVTRAGR